MKIRKYLKDKILYIISTCILLCIIILLLSAFKSNKELIITIAIIYLLNAILFLVFDYLKRKKFYDFFLNNLEKFDKKYLIVEMLKKPNFLEVIK